MPASTYYQEPGPFSSVFPYEQLAQEEEEKKKKLISGQQKIQRTNALGEALRLIIDSVGATKGATVVPRDVNPGIFRASDRIRALEDRSDANLERLRLIDLQNRQKDIAYQQDLAAEGRAADRRAGELKQKRDWDVADTEAEQKFRAEEAEKSRQGAMDLENQRSKNDLDQIYAREKAKQKYLNQDNPFSARYRGIYGDTKPYMAIPDMELGVDIPLSDTDAMQILKWMRSDPAVRDIDKLNIKPNDLTNNLVFKNLVIQNWDRYKDLVRKLASGEKISPADEKAMVDMGARAKRTEEYETKRSAIDVNRKKGAKQLQELNAEYSDILNDGQAPGGTGQIELKPEEGAKIDGVINAEGYSPEQKRSAVYGYLVKQGYDQTSAKDFAEFVYSNLK